LTAAINAHALRLQHRTFQDAVSTPITNVIYCILQLIEKFGALVDAGVQVMTEDAASLLEQQTRDLDKDLKRQIRLLLKAIELVQPGALPFLFAH
jgi:hypothetical protein